MDIFYIKLPVFTRISASSLIKLAEKITFKISNHLDVAILFISKLKELKIVPPGISTIEDLLLKANITSENKIGGSSRKCGFTTLSQYLYFSIGRVNPTDTPLKTR